MKSVLRRQLSWPLRLLCLIAGCGVLAVLILARCLEPDAEGFGTHQQLGLPPCTSIVLFDSPCPACGMTTSWSWILRGRVDKAIQANAGGSMLALIALVYLPASCYFFFVGKGSPRERFSLWLAVALILSIAVATLQWLIRFI